MCYFLNIWTEPLFDSSYTLERVLLMWLGLAIFLFLRRYGKLTLFLVLFLIAYALGYRTERKPRRIIERSLNDQLAELGFERRPNEVRRRVRSGREGTQIWLHREALVYFMISVQHVGGPDSYRLNGERGSTFLLSSAFGFFGGTWSKPVFGLDTINAIADWGQLETVRESDRKLMQFDDVESLPEVLPDYSTKVMTNAGRLLSDVEGARTTLLENSRFRYPPRVMTWRSFDRKTNES